MLFCIILTILLSLNLLVINSTTSTENYLLNSFSSDFILDGNTIIDELLPLPDVNYKCNQLYEQLIYEEYYCYYQNRYDENTYKIKTVNEFINLYMNFFKLPKDIILDMNTNLFNDVLNVQMYFSLFLDRTKNSIKNIYKYLVEYYLDKIYYIIDDNVYYNYADEEAQIYNIKLRYFTKKTIYTFNDDCMNLLLSLNNSICFTINKHKILSLLDKY